MFGVSAWVRSQPVVPDSAFSSVIGLAAANDGSPNASPSVIASWRVNLRKPLLTLALLLLALPLDLLEALLALLAGRRGRRRGHELLGRGRTGHGHENRGAVPPVQGGGEGVERSGRAVAVAAVRLIGQAGSGAGDYDLSVGRLGAGE